MEKNPSVFGIEQAWKTGWYQIASEIFAINFKIRFTVTKSALSAELNTH